MKSTTIGLDIAKNVFQAHGVDAKGNVVLRKVLKRRGELANPNENPWACDTGETTSAEELIFSR